MPLPSLLSCILCATLWCIGDVPGLHSRRSQVRVCSTNHMQRQRTKLFLYLSSRSIIRSMSKLKVSSMFCNALTSCVGVRALRKVQNQLNGRRAGRECMPSTRSTGNNKAELIKACLHFLPSLFLTYFMHDFLPHFSLFKRSLFLNLSALPSMFPSFHQCCFSIDSFRLICLSFPSLPHSKLSLHRDFLKVVLLFVHNYT